MKYFPQFIISLFVLFPVWNTPIAIAQFREAGVQQFKIPVEAPEFKLKELGGGQFSLSEFRGKVIILNFFAIW